MALSEIWPVHSSGSHVSVTVGPAPSPTTFSRAGAEALPAASEATAVSGNGATDGQAEPVGGRNGAVASLPPPNHPAPSAAKSTRATSASAAAVTVNPPFPPAR